MQCHPTTNRHELTVLSENNFISLPPFPGGDKSTLFICNNSATIFWKSLSPSEKIQGEKLSAYMLFFLLELPTCHFETLPPSFLWCPWLWCSDFLDKGRCSNMKLSHCLEEELGWQSIITWGFWNICHSKLEHTCEWHKGQRLRTRNEMPNIWKITYNNLEFRWYQRITNQQRS